MDLFRSDRARQEALATAWVVPEPSRCVQCGICTFHCPMSIDVRRFVWQGEPVKDSRCLTCGECVKRCPRGLLRFEKAGAVRPPARLSGEIEKAARRHVLIGSGPGALSTAETIRRLDPRAEITIIGAEPQGYYSRPGLAYFLANEEPERTLFPFTKKDVAKLNVQLIPAVARRIDTERHVVVIDGGREIPYDRLLIATGSLAVPVDVPGAELEGVVKLDNMTDAHDLIGKARHAKTAVVVGGGITALEIVEGLRVHKVHVHYFMRKDRYWSNVLSERESHIVEEGLRARGVEIHYFTELTGIRGRSGRVAAVQTDKGEEIACDMVAVAIGVRPQIDLAREAGLDCGRGILVDEYLRSSDPDIFAAGDVAEVCDTGTDLRTLEVLWNSAVEKGRIAGLNMTCDPARTYDKGAAPLNVTRLAGFKITIIGTVGSGKDSDLKGMTRGGSQIWGEVGEAAMIESQVDQAHIRLALGKSTIGGAVVMGDQALSFPLQEIIGARADVSAIIPKLMEPDAPIAEIVNQFWDEWKVQRV